MLAKFALAKIVLIKWALVAAAWVFGSTLFGENKGIHAWLIETICWNYSLEQGEVCDGTLFLSDVVVPEWFKQMCTETCTIKIVKESNEEDHDEKNEEKILETKNTTKKATYTAPQNIPTKADAISASVQTSPETGNIVPTTHWTNNEQPSLEALVAKMLWDTTPSQETKYIETKKPTSVAERIAKKKSMQDTTQKEQYSLEELLGKLLED